MRLAYKFRPVPQDRDPRWFAGSWALRSIAIELAVSYCGSDPDPTFAVSERWQDDLLRIMCVDPRHRGPVARALNQAHQLGLITVSGGSATVHFRPVPRKYPADTPQIPFAEVVEIAQLPKPQTDRIEEDNTERAGARVCGGGEWAGPSAESAAAGRRWFDELTGCRSPDFAAHREWYSRIGGKPPDQRDRVARNIRATQWCRDNIRKVTPRHVIAYWEQYLDGPRNATAERASRVPEGIAYKRLA